jgi:hypothetical protein
MKPQDDIYHRRTDMLTLKGQGGHISQIIGELSTKYHVSERQLWRDWATRQQWAREISRLKDPTIIDQALLGMQEIIPHAWLSFQRSNNEMVKLGALRLAKETYMDIVTYLKDSGLTVKNEGIEHILRWDETCNNPFLSNTTRTTDKASSTTAKQDSESSAAADDGAKQSLEPTKPSNSHPKQEQTQSASA